MLTELMARSLREDELAARLIDHDDPGARELARRFIGGTEIGTELQEAMRKLESAESDLADEEHRNATMRELLDEVSECDGECSEDLLTRLRREI